MQGIHKGDIVINIPTSLSWLIFQPECSTGIDPNTQPGIGFELRRYPDVPPEITTHGVISRVDAQELHAMLGRFLTRHPPKR